MQKYVKHEKRYRLIKFICLLAVYKILIGTGRVLGTSILRYDEILSRIDFRKILFSVGHWLLNSVICGFGKSIRKQKNTHH